jgi:hypothetical protein
LARLELVEERDALLDRNEVGEHAAEPAAVDVWLTGPRGFLRDRLLGLLLRADEEHAIATSDGLAGGVDSEIEPSFRLSEVDDVDPVALREDERAHLGIPATGLVAKMDTGLQKLSHRNGRHERTSCGCFLRSAPVENREPRDSSGTAHDMAALRVISASGRQMAGPAREPSRRDDRRGV